MTTTTRPTQPSTAETPSWKRWLDPATLPGAVLAAVIGGLIVLGITAAASLL